ncbi:DUF2117 domain-containing protein [Methanoregula sp. PtaB.Bin085]|nr:DUF2117 domain-containing protein [Methanoregula sp. PtaB.Bin085]
MTITRRNNPSRSPAVMVAHGPALFDSGDAARLMGLFAPSRVIVAGVMARTAAEESGLPVEFDGRPPSRVIMDTEGPVFLANRGKTPHSGRVFGEIVASRLGSGGLVHIECSDGRVYCWNGGDRLLAADCAARAGYTVTEAWTTDFPPGRTRKIRGCIPGEPVYVNGIVIGHATAETVELQSDDGVIGLVSGLVPKPHGLEKLGRAGTIEIGTAWCKSGQIRSAAARAGRRAARHGRIVVIDHCGHSLYPRLSGDCCGVVAVGDDTTAVCGHICLHRGIPVLGITDNDADTILPSAFAPGSVILDTRPERDDDIGAEIAASVPHTAVFWDNFIREVISRLSGRAAVVLDLREALP